MNAVVQNPGVKATQRKVFTKETRAAALIKINLVEIVKFKVAVRNKALFC